MKPIVAITMGDPVGVGPEILIKALQEKEIYTVCRPVVIGSAIWLQQIASLLGLPFSVFPLSSLSQGRFQPGRVEVVDIAASSLSEWRLGVPHPEASRSAWAAMERAASLALSRDVDAIVTTPISKRALKQIGFPDVGHTEFFARMANVSRFGMMMVFQGFKIMLATIHLPLREAIPAIRRELLLEKICLTAAALETDFGLPRGKIAVAALNPHAGEGGMLGEEEKKEILPAIVMAQENGMEVSGPYPADTLFYQLKEGRFDAVVALYHDQGLIPAKLLAFGRTVNVTVGLPFIRTSVDHGTAYDIAGKGVANPGSLIEAILLAHQMARNRALGQGGASGRLFGAA